jgi:hypothetical protein
MPKVQRDRGPAASGRPRRSPRARAAPRLRRPGVRSRRRFRNRGTESVRRSVMKWMRRRGCAPHRPGAARGARAALGPPLPAAQSSAAGWPAAGRGVASPPTDADTCHSAPLRSAGRQACTAARAAATHTQPAASGWLAANQRSIATRTCPPGPEIAGFGCYTSCAPIHKCHTKTIYCEKR